MTTLDIGTRVTTRNMPEQGTGTVVETDATGRYPLALVRFASGGESWFYDRDLVPND